MISWFSYHWTVDTIVLCEMVWFREISRCNSSNDKVTLKIKARTLAKYSLSRPSSISCQWIFNKLGKNIRLKEAVCITFKSHMYSLSIKDHICEFIQREWEKWSVIACIFLLSFDLQITLYSYSIDTTCHMQDHGL